MFILSVAFLTCFAALIALGGVSAYAAGSRRERAALLAAAEILSVRESAEESAVRVSAALATARAEDFLSETDAQLLTEMLGVRDARFFALCDAIDKMLSENRFSVSAFIRVLRSAAEEAGTLSDAVRVQSPQEMAALVGLHRDYAALASDFIGVRNIFSADQTCAYCGNAVIVYDSESARPVAYAVAATPGEIRLTKQACVLAALEYAAGKFELRAPTLLSAEIRGGICHTVIDAEGCNAVAGVRMDTGSVVYFRIGDT